VTCPQIAPFSSRTGVLRAKGLCPAIGVRPTTPAATPQKCDRLIAAIAICRYPPPLFGEDARAWWAVRVVSSEPPRSLSS
jgi:hypothetical protein